MEADMRATGACAAGSREIQSSLITGLTAGALVDAELVAERQYPDLQHESGTGETLDERREGLQNR
jgi:hypothetical protein